MNAVSADTGPVTVEPFGCELAHGGLDDRLLFGAERAALAGVRIQSEHEHPRPLDAEALRCRSRVRDADQSSLELRAVERVRDGAQRQVRRCERYAQRLAGEQHHGLRSRP